MGRKRKQVNWELYKELKEKGLTDSNPYGNVYLRRMWCGFM